MKGPALGAFVIYIDSKSPGTVLRCPQRSSYYILVCALVTEVYLRVELRDIKEDSKVEGLSYEILEILASIFVISR